MLRPTRRHRPAWMPPCGRESPFAAGVRACAGLSEVARTHPATPLSAAADRGIGPGMPPESTVEGSDWEGNADSVDSRNRCASRLGKLGDCRASGWTVKGGGCYNNPASWQKYGPEGGSGTSTQGMA